MITVSDLPQSLPIFPLPGAMLLPRARLPLHLFEPRYLAMLDDTLKTEHRLIGMIQPRDVPEGSQERLHAIGCAGRVTSFAETDDGRYMITLSGVSRFRMGHEIEGFAPYRKAEVSWDGFARDLGKTESDQNLDRTSFLELLGRYFSAHELDTDWDSLREAGDELLINSLSMLCPFAPDDKQALLEAPSLGTRREMLVTLIEFGLRSGDGTDVIQ